MLVLLLVLAVALIGVRTFANGARLDMIEDKLVNLVPPGPAPETRIEADDTPAAIVPEEAGVPLSNTTALPPAAPPPARAAPPPSDKKKKQPVQSPVKRKPPAKKQGTVTPAAKPKPKPKPTPAAKASVGAKPVVGGEAKAKGNGEKDRQPNAASSAEPEKK